MLDLSFATRVLILFGTLVLALVALQFIAPIPQDPSYHAFADARSCLGISNFGDTVSNLGFALVGLWGLYRVSGERGADIFVNRIEVWPYLIFFTSVALASVGSAYYHIDPNNAGLFWDRLPMTVAFMAIFAAFIADRVRADIAIRWLLPVLIALAVLSLSYWDMTEARGVGDLRYYGLIQFYPIMVLPLILWLFPKGTYTTGGHLTWLVFWYGLAKALEFFDYEVFALLGGLISGPTLKHMAASVSAVVIVRMLTLNDSSHRADSLESLA